ncbi:MAG: N-acetylmuramoyl-L-alanine amidase [Myxococcota bacterium]
MTYLDVPESLGARSRFLLDEVRAGRFLLSWVPLRMAGGRLTLYVFNDALLWEDGVRYAVSTQLQQWIADELEAMLPTPEIVDAIWLAADAQMAPKTQSISKGVSANRNHSARIDADLDAREGLCASSLVAGWKDWCLDLRCFDKGRAVNYGWHGPRPEAAMWRGIKLHAPATAIAHRVIQPVADGHNIYHSDYSQLCRLVRRKAVLDGEEVDLADVVRSLELSKLVHHSVLPNHRHPTVDILFDRPTLRPAPAPNSRGAGDADKKETDPSMPATTEAPEPSRYGDRGLWVEEWQRFLEEEGYNPGPVDGIHGRLTESATIRWREDQRPSAPPDRETSPDASTAPSWLKGAPLIRARKFTPANRTRDDIRLVVLHSTENTIRRGVARNVAMWFGGLAKRWTPQGMVPVPAPHASTHYVFDAEEIIVGLESKHVAWTAPSANRVGVQLEFVGQAALTDWSSGDGLAVLRNGAKVTAYECAENQIPIRRLVARDLLEEASGIATHAVVTESIALAKREPAKYKRAPWYRADRGKWADSDHVDPGLWQDRRWPWDLFLELVEEERRRL